MDRPYALRRPGRPQPPRDLTGSARRGGDRGETLVELLITMVILSIAVVAVVGGLATAVRMSDVHRKQATAGAAVRAFAESLQARVAASSTGYLACADPVTRTTDYPLTGANPVYTAPTSYTASYLAVAYWVPASSSFVSAPAASCVDVGVQRLTLQVRSNDSRAVETLDVVLRKPCRESDPVCS